MKRHFALVAAFLVALSSFAAVALVAPPSALRAQSQPKTYLPSVPNGFPPPPPTPTPLATFSDNFSNPNSGWVTGTLTDPSGNPIATLSYVEPAGNYQILSLKQNASPYVSYLITSGLDANGHTGLVAGDFQATMQAWAQSSNPQGTTGFYFGANYPQFNTNGTCVSSSNYGVYDFEIGTIATSKSGTLQSQYYLARFNYAANDPTCTTGAWCTIIPATQPCSTPGSASSPAILPGNGVNTIEVTRSGNTITLFANGQQLAQVNDSNTPLPPQGFLGLDATPDAAGFDARFDNFQLSCDSSCSLGNAGPSTSRLNTTSREVARPIPRR